MTNSDLVLNIAVNLGRLGRWAQSGQTPRISQFLADTQIYLDQIQSIDPQFRSTYARFLKDYQFMRSTSPNPDGWSDTAFTWAVILTHRAKLA